MQLYDLAFKVIKEEINGVKYLPYNYLESAIKSYCNKYGYNLSSHDLNEVKTKIMDIMNNIR